MVEWWSTGVLEYWSGGVVEYWSTGTSPLSTTPPLPYSNTPLLQYSTTPILHHSIPSPLEPGYLPLFSDDSPGSLYHDECQEKSNEDKPDEWGAGLKTLGHNP